MTTSESKVVLVMLATGKQGTGLVRGMISLPLRVCIDTHVRPQPKVDGGAQSGGPLPFTILAQTRSATGAKSHELAALPGVRARALADAAAAYGVKHFVYSAGNFGGTGGYGRSPAEAYLRAVHPNLTRTILRPVTFMDELLPGPSTVERITTIMFLCQLLPDTRLQLVAGSDIGRVAALTFAAPEKWVGCVVDVAGDAQTPREMEAGWRTVKGREMRPSMVGGSALSWAVESATRDLRLISYDADIAAARELYPEMKDVPAD
ncbi:hypothetical protein FB451DRAFT_1339756 [Mycena latifolia]|nr:hypothetical protein FB451DRAFT_1339756 [Mycena latifolia]